HRMPVNAQRLGAYRELVAAGVMEPVAGADGMPEVEFRFTEEGWARREEILRDAEDHLLELEPHLPERVNLSSEARAVLRRHLAGDREVTPENLGCYRELAAAGIMYPVGSFIGGWESAFHFTHRGWERRFELAEVSCAKSDA